LPDPVLGSINELEGAPRAQFLVDMVAIGDALLAVTGAYRINYEIQGNSDPEGALRDWLGQRGLLR
jgi:hypothetical protein